MAWLAVTSAPGVTVGLPMRPEIAAPILAGAFVFASDLLRALARQLGYPLLFR